MTQPLSRWREGLAKTSQKAFGRVASLLGATEITQDVWNELEALLIEADAGVSTSQEIIAVLRSKVQNRGLRGSNELQAALKQELRRRLIEPPALDWRSSPTVILIVGANGSGKTTTIGKLVHYFQARQKTVLLGAADTFRAAAAEQLEVWANRTGAAMISGSANSDPGAVAYNTVQAGMARRADLIILDTAGRLHTRTNLMEELKKVHRVVGNALPGAPQAVWLVLDATTGQNGLLQARAFKEAVGLTGLILAKLDTSARGGMAFSIQKELGLPVMFVGLGEALEDLELFAPDAFVEGLLARP